MSDPILSQNPAPAPHGADDPRLALARGFIESLPHCQALNMQLVGLAPGEAWLSLPYAEHLVGNPATGVIHGGAVSTLLDTASGTAVMCHPAGPISAATLNLRIDYMRPATPQQMIRAHAICHHVTRSIAFVRVTAYDDDATRPVAAGTGVFTITLPKGAKP